MSDEARRPEDQQECAHLRVLYRTEQIEGGRTRGWWACDLCRAKFVTVASAEYAVAQAVPELTEERNALRAALAGRDDGLALALALDEVRELRQAQRELREAVGDYLAPHESRSHPGSGGDPDAAQRLQRVRDAYAEALRREPQPAQPPPGPPGGHALQFLPGREPAP